LSESDLLFVKFANAFEDKFIRQGEDENRSIEESLAIGWDLLAMLPKGELKRIRQEWIDKYYPKSA
jgi:V/A-type H+-transporting ATPase subunit B